MLYSAENAPAPFDCTSNWRLVPCQRGSSLVVVKYFTSQIYLAAELLQDINELAHHLLLDGALRLDLFEVQEQLKGTLSAPQLPETGINELASGDLYSFARHRSVKPHRNAGKMRRLLLQP